MGRFKQQPELVEFGKTITKARIMMGMSQADLARKFGFKTNQTICHWEHGYYKPTPKNQKKLEDILGIDCSVFFREDKSMSLRELLDRVGNLSQIMSWTGIEIVPKDRNRPEDFSVSWEMDPEGCGPAFEYSDGTKTYPPFYHIPESGERNPESIRNVNINWDDTGWIVAPYSWKRVKEQLISIQYDYAMVGGACE